MQLFKKKQLEKYNFHFPFFGSTFHSNCVSNLGPVDTADLNSFFFFKENVFVLFRMLQCFFEKTAAILAGWGSPLVRNSFIHCLGSFFFRYAPS